MVGLPVTAAGVQAIDVPDILSGIGALRLGEDKFILAVFIEPGRFENAAFTLQKVGNVFRIIKNPVSATTGAGVPGADPDASDLADTCEQWYP